MPTHASRLPLPPRAHALLLAVALAVAPAPARAQRADSVAAAPVPPPVAGAPSGRAPWLVQATTYYNTVDNGFGVWRGADARILYSGRRVSPFVSAGTQTRPGGSQQVLSFGSYIPLTNWLLTVVGVGMAPDRGVVYFPKLRRDVSAILTVPKVKGLLLAGGVTDVRYTNPQAGGIIVTTGPVFYKGSGVYSGTVFLNRDRASGARSSAWQANAQWGRQGSHWVGGGVGAGTEAYRLLVATPFDARFESQSANVFATRWLRPGLGATLRADLERKTKVYLRQALTLTLFTEF